MNLRRVLYIGQYQEGTTSYSRGRALKELLPEAEVTFIDTVEPLLETSRIFRSVGFRWKVGPLVDRVNALVRKHIDGHVYELIWVDKGVYLTEATTKMLRLASSKLIHFTPDPAFRFHYSRHFEKSLRLYDLAVTTKSYELDEYVSRLGEQRVMLVTQGFDATQHYSMKAFEDRIPGVCFIGHHERARQEIVEAILDSKIDMFVAGRGWERLARKRRRNGSLVFGGKGVYGHDYARRLNDYQFGLGLLSKWVPEKHTTRTFEIPACESILITERNSETESMFKGDEVLFYVDTASLLEGLRYLLNRPSEAEVIARKGHRRVQGGGFEYKEIVKRILASIFKPVRS